MTVVSQLRERAKATHILSKRFRSSGATDGLVASSAFQMLAMEIRTCDFVIRTRTTESIWAHPIMLSFSLFRRWFGLSSSHNLLYLP